MSNGTIQRRAALLGIAAGLGRGGSSRAQSNWPAGPVTLVVPFPAGGGTDAFARPLAAQFAKNTGKTLVVDNRGGAGGTLGASFAARAAPDGYTPFMGAVPHAIAPAMFPRLDYDIEKDLIALALLANVPQGVVVHPGTPSANFRQFLEHVKRHPAKLNYGSAGAGTSQHLAAELFKQQTGTFITHIPYRGAGPALQDLIAGNVDMMFDGLGSSATHIKNGPLKALILSATPPRPPGRAGGRPGARPPRCRRASSMKSSAWGAPKTSRPCGPATARTTAA